jgi:ribosomal protein S18 acetylase RimI-like enzyme
LFSDALGELVEYDAEGLTVATRRGPVRIGHDAIQAAKRVPPRTLDIATLERLAAAAWPAPDVEALGGWTLRAAAGWTNRGNSALAIGDPGRPLDAALGAVTAWYRARGLAPRVAVPLPLGADLDAALGDRGWTRSVAALVQTAPVAAVLAATTDRPDLPPVRLAPVPDGAWLDVVSRRKGELSDAARHILTATRLVRYASVEGDHGPVEGDHGPVHGDHGPVHGDLAVARGAVVRDLLHLALVEVAEPARGRGLAQHVTRALAQWGRGAGAGTVVLQVEETNAPALGLYRKLGFRTHHPYVTWTAPDRRD